MFKDDFLVFSIGKRDLVLGIQWRYPLEDIKFNFRKLSMEFEYQGKMITLRGIEPDFKAVSTKSLEKMSVTSPQFSWLRLRGQKVLN